MARPTGGSHDGTCSPPVSGRHAEDPRLQLHHGQGPESLTLSGNRLTADPLLQSRGAEPSSLFLSTAPPSPCRVRSSVSAAGGVVAIYDSTMRLVQEPDGGRQHLQDRHRRQRMSWVRRRQRLLPIGVTKVGTDRRHHGVGRKDRHGTVSCSTATDRSTAVLTGGAGGGLLGNALGNDGTSTACRKAALHMIQAERFPTISPRANLGRGTERIIGVRRRFVDARLLSGWR